MSIGKQKGRVLLLKIGDGEATETFSPFLGLTSKSLSINNERVDVTTPGIDADVPIWRDTFDGVKSVSVSGDYMLVDDAQEARLFAVAMEADAVANFEIFVPGVGTFSGAFSVEAEVSGDETLRGSLSLESTGPVAFAPAP